MIRFSSTESVRTNSSSSINLKEDLSELAELQQQTAAAQQVPSYFWRGFLVLTSESAILFVKLIFMFLFHEFFFLPHSLYTVSTFGIEKSFGGW